MASAWAEERRRRTASVLLPRPRPLTGSRFAAFPPDDDAFKGLCVIDVLPRCSPAGPGPLSSDWPEEGREGLQTHHPQLLREGDV